MTQSAARHIDDFAKYYFLGIGGIGMSALARYFKQLGKEVGGYDKTPSPLTDELLHEGIQVHFEDLGSDIPQSFQDKAECLVVITPAVPSNLGELNYLREAGFEIKKRSEVLGMITRNSKALTVAGTHGKTTTSALLAHILKDSGVGCNAFLGGISSNYNSNFISDSTSEYTVIEADEFDRSFLRLKPFASIVTTTDADHLDIYGDDAEFQKGFHDFVGLIDPMGFLVKHLRTAVSHPNSISYAYDAAADYQLENLRYENRNFLFDLKKPDGAWKDIVLGIPGIHNAENAVACIAMCEQIGLNEHQIRQALANFKGVKRRFEQHIKRDDLIYIDDYAHHPTEIKALIDSIKLLYPEHEITGIFQPHLFSRTRDFFAGFAEQLSRLDRCILMPIYPAREEPIPGITSDALLDEIDTDQKHLMTAEQILQFAQKGMNSGVILSIGAGDIDRIVEPLKTALSDR